MRNIFFILLLFISSCGYQSIYLNKSLENFEYKKVNLSGDNYINKKIISLLSIKESDEANITNELLISSILEIKEVSKDSKGQVELYKSIISVNLKIKNINDNIIKDQNFNKEFSYNNRKNKFDLVEYQNSIKDDLINKIVNDIIIYLNSEW